MHFLQQLFGAMARWTIAIIGAQVGDEGKAKVMDAIVGWFCQHLPKKAIWVVRFGGSDNAGHTVVRTINGGEKVRFIFHLLPCSLLHPNGRGLITGCYINPLAFAKESEELMAKVGWQLVGRVFVAERNYLTLPCYLDMEKAMELARGKEKVGSTLKGVSPTAVLKMLRCSVLAGDVRHKRRFVRAVNAALAQVNIILRGMGQPEIPQKGYAEKCWQDAQVLRPYLCDGGKKLAQLHQQGAIVLYEGAQGTMLDIDHGMTPYVTCSTTTIGGIQSGPGVGLGLMRRVFNLGITKAYVTRVGSGALPTIMQEDIRTRVQKRGEEVGATTGRVRTCGWLDMVMLWYAIRVNGFTALALTKLDVLDEELEIKICVGYRLRGRIIRDMPYREDDWAACEPVYETMPGWQRSTAGITKFAQLPVNAKRFVLFVQELCGIPIVLTSTGKDAADVIYGPGSVDLEAA